jgi:enamine deaminase RidA (YjgF/YER057c/UK114 family)
MATSWPALAAPDGPSQGAGVSNAQLAATTTARGLVYVSGITASASARTGDVGVQVADVLRQLDAILRGADSSLGRAVSLQVQLRHATDFAAMNAAYAPFFNTSPPVRTTIVAPPEAPGALVEVSAVAAAAGVPREVITPAGWKASPNPYSYGIRAADLVFLSGLVARSGRTNEVVAGDMATQVGVIFDNAADILQAAGLTLRDIVNAKVFVTEMGLVGAMNDAYRSRMPTPRPSRATAVTALMNPQYVVEMTFIAAAGKSIVGRPGVEPQPDATLQAGVAVGSRVFVSGMLAADLKASLDDQTRSVVERLTAVLTAAGYDWSHVHEATLYVTDVSQAAAARAAWRAAIGRDLPAGATLVTGLVVADPDVEIMVSASKP